MTARIIYISSAARSGSTLLDQLLASHPQITSVGEALHLKAYALENRRDYDPAHPLVCSCGEAVPQCAFWRAVERELERPLHSLRLAPRLLYGPSTPRGTLTRRLARMLQLRPSLYQSPLVHGALGGNALGADSAALFDAIAEVSGSSHVLDSSKMPYRFWSLQRVRPGDVWLLLLCRDYRAVAHSTAKRSASPRRAALLGGVRTWRTRLQQMEVLARDFPADRVIRVRYEDLCAEPEQTMRRLSDFLGLPFAQQTLTRASHGLHHIGGSPSKFSPEHRAIHLDTDYLQQLTAEEAAAMRPLAGERAVRWGYE